jgi:hypothetical protein
VRAAVDLKAELWKLLLLLLILLLV